MITPILDRAGWSAIADLGDLGALLPLAGAITLAGAVVVRPPSTIYGTHASHARAPLKLASARL